MVGRHACFALVAVGALFLSGCAGSSATPNATSQSPSSVVEASGEPIADAGSISGTVTDDAIQPLAGATVGILQTDLTASTAADGSFKFQNLAPGKYVVSAQKLGYESASKATEVGASSEAKVSFLLTPLAVKGARSDFQEFKVFMACGFGLVAVTATTSGALCPEQVFGTAKVTVDHSVTQDVVDMVGELVWQGSSALSAKQMSSPRASTRPAAARPPSRTNTGT